LPATGSRGPSPPPPSAPLTTAAQLARLRLALAQLCEGVLALHRAGHLHRDIKPSNVMVTATATSASGGTASGAGAPGDPRIVLLDFGVVLELGAERKATDQVVGTPAYMAPEQGAGLPLSEATDWYAVGVMLYEALAGRRPFRGGTREVLEAKQNREPPPIRPPDRRARGVLSDGAADDLIAVCMGLLARDPGQRMSGPELLDRLGMRRRPARATDAPVLSATPTDLMGRARHLGALDAAFHAARAGKPRTVLVSGPSGMGKSALCHAFLDAVGAERAAVVLAGRCYEQESVPYKALDSLVDALCRHLLELPRRQVWNLMPRNAGALARLFPVLRRVEAILGAPQDALDTQDPHELRQRGFTALRRLLDRLAERKPLILYMDDLQWADRDSAALLAEVLRPPSPPPMLLIASFRSEDAAANAFLRALRGDGTQDAGRDTSGLRPGVVDVMVEELDPADARALAATLLAQSGASDIATHAERIAVESEGSPFFIHELCRYARASATSAEGAGDIHLDDVLHARVADLPAPARALLELAAVAGHPIAQTVALRAGADGADERTLALLRNQHFLRTGGTPARATLETYHDRIRESVVAHLAAARLADCHVRLARALEATGEGDPETLAVHYGAASENDRAGQYCETAAALAADALAFDRAAALYRRALALLTLTDERQVALLMRLGDALVHAGRGPEAADAFLGAAKKAEPTTRRRCQIQGAQQLLVTGHIERGMAVLSQLLGEVGAALAATPRRALASLFWQRLRLRLRLRGLGWTERPEAEIDRDVLARLDVYQVVSEGLATIDPVHGASLQARSVLLALRLGEKTRVGRALGVEALYAASSGRPRGIRRAHALVAETHRIAERGHDATLAALAVFAGGLVHELDGDFRTAAERMRDAEDRFRALPVGFTWELNNLRLVRLGALIMLGELSECRTLLSGHVRDAERRGDLYAETSMKRITNLLWLAADDPAGARRSLAATSWAPPEHGYHLQHYYELVALTGIAFYENTVVRDHAELGRGFAALEHSLLVHTGLVRVIGRRLRAGLLVALARDQPAIGLAAARRAVRRLAQERFGYAQPWVLLLGAALAAQSGDSGRAGQLLADATCAARERHLGLEAAAARRHRGRLLGGSQGADLIAEADAWLAGQGAVAPARLVEVVAPGFPRTGAAAEAGPGAPKSRP
jgi:hypothetical protein